MRRTNVYQRQLTCGSKLVVLMRMKRWLKLISLLGKGAHSDQSLSLNAVGSMAETPRLCETGTLIEDATLIANGFYLRIRALQEVLLAPIPRRVGAYVYGGPRAWHQLGWEVSA